MKPPRAPAGREIVPSTAGASAIRSGSVERGGAGCFEGDIRLPAEAIRQAPLAPVAPEQTTAWEAEDESEPEPEPERAPGERHRALKPAGRPWPNAVVRYRLAPDLPDPGRVLAAIHHWEQVTHLRFERIEVDSGDHLVFCHRDGCWSHVGMQGGRQELALAPAADRGAVIHELGHAVGLWHQHSRDDRDEHIQIVRANIDPNCLHNFDVHVRGPHACVYDLASVMHYPRDAFSRNGRDTIVPRRPGHIGQRAGLSPGDIAAVRRLYP